MHHDSNHDHNHTDVNKAAAKIVQIGQFLLRSMRHNKCVHLLGPRNHVLQYPQLWEINSKSVPNRQSSA